MKICNRCGGRVEDKSNFCPYCKSNSFKPAGDVAVKQGEIVNASKNNTLVHQLFYWNQKGSYIMSKSKVGALSVFLIFFLSAFSTTNFIGIVILGFFFAFITYVIGLVLHNITGGYIKSPMVLKYNDYGLLSDLKHLLFYWQNHQTGAYALSKTKLITFVIFLTCALFALTTNPGSLFVVVCVGLFFATPAFAIGFVIHKLTNSNPEGEIIPKKVKTSNKPQIPKKEQPKVTQNTAVKPVVVEKYSRYRIEADELKSEFIKKDENVRILIKKRFEPPQLTYTRFISIVDKSKDLFIREYESIINMIELGDENSPRIDAEIKSRIEVLRQIIQKDDDLANELVLTMDTTQDTDVGNLIDDMEDLIKSVKDYK